MEAVDCWTVRRGGFSVQGRSPLGVVSVETRARLALVLRRRGVMKEGCEGGLSRVWLFQGVCMGGRAMEGGCSGCVVSQGVCRRGDDRR